MKKMFIKNKIIIFRVLGTLMLIVGFGAYFWTTPKEGLTQNEIAAANIARMEAKVSGRSGAFSKAPEPSSAKIMQEFKNAQEKQLQYLTIMTMIFGVGFLVYSFFSSKKEES